MNPVQEEASSKVKNVNAEPLSSLSDRKETVARSLLVRYYNIAREITRACAPQSRLVLRRPCGRRPELLVTGGPISGGRGILGCAALPRVGFRRWPLAVGA